VLVAGPLFLRTVRTTKVPLTPFKRDKRPGKPSSGSKNASSINEWKESAIYKITQMRFDGACLVSTPCKEKTSGHTLSNDVVGEVAGLASAPSGFWKRNLRNGRKTLEGTDLTLKVEAINKKPSQEAPESIPSSTKSLQKQ
jgi:hypothetical protein